MHRNEVRSTFNLWVSLLSETRKMSRERAAFGEVLASEMTARLDVMAKDVQMLTKKASKSDGYFVDVVFRYSICERAFRECVVKTVSMLSWAVYVHSSVCFDI